MNIKETVKSFVDKLAPNPPPDWEEYIQKVNDGKNGGIPIDGFEELIFEYYGQNTKKQVEQGRVRFPLQGNSLEISYHVTKNPDGSFVVVKEGIFPYAG